MKPKSKLLQFFAKKDPYQPGREVYFIDPNGQEVTGNVTAIMIREIDFTLSLCYEVQAQTGEVHELLSAQVFDTKKEMRK